MTREKITREEMARTCEAYGETMPNWYGLALHAAAAELRKMDWQPIATAPKDGTPFMVYWLKSVNDEPELDIVESWDSYVVYVGCGSPADYWMPLPLPPANTEAVTP